MNNLKSLEPLLSVIFLLIDIIYLLVRSQCPDCLFLVPVFSLIMLLNSLPIIHAQAWKSTEKGMMLILLLTFFGILCFSCFNLNVSDICKMVIKGIGYGEIFLSLIFMLVKVIQHKNEMIADNLPKLYKYLSLFAILTSLFVVSICFI